ncbi:hypothetical protein KDA82_35920 [Streptomyces daliensis]|uniref:SCO6045-like C-terminal domain-containing protein n=1 Tax=Streptomyces daliensis TaxID=299421 RepID=A0A8T4J4T4_9ACTN|nr:hypothetical protein [Streptomyces daliensis]
MSEHRTGQPDAPAPAAEGGAPDPVADARERLAHAQHGLLAALVSGAPAPEGFDEERLAVQTRALTAKRADVIAKVAPELPRILGEKEYRAAFVAYARGRPMTGGYRRDALDFAEELLRGTHPLDANVRRHVHRWWRERSGPAPLPRGRLRRALRALRGR